MGVAAYFGATFNFDASSDTLVVKGDPDLAAYERVAKTFGGDEFLLVTFTPHAGAALDHANLATLRELQNRLQVLDGVDSIFSILDAPLLRSPPVPLAELANGFLTLESAGVDLELARQELRASPVFSSLLITPDGETTGLRVKLMLDDVHTTTKLVKQAAGDATTITGHIKRGRGSVGALVMDEQLFDDLQELARDLKHNPWKFFWKE